MKLFSATLIGVFIPYLFNCCQDIAHNCSECDHEVAVQKYKDYKGAEGQPPTVFRPEPPRPKGVKTQYPDAPRTAALPDTVRVQPREMEVRHLREMEVQEMEVRQLQEMDALQLQEMEDLQKSPRSVSRMNR